MKLIQSLLLLSLGFSSSAHAAIEIELAGGQSSELIEGTTEEEEDSLLKTSNISLYLGYRFKSFPLSLGFIGTQRTYDMSEAVEDDKAALGAFYQDPDLFDPPATILSQDMKMSRKGLLYGPQMTLGIEWKYFQPYIRASYQVGTISNDIDYQSTGEFQGSALAFDLKAEEKFKAALTQYGLGFRIPIKMVYLFVDILKESLKLSADSGTYSGRVAIGDFEQELNIVGDDSLEDKYEAVLGKIGLGLVF